MSLSVCVYICLSVYVCRSSDQQRDSCDGVERTARWQEAQRSDSQVTDSLVTLLQLIQS